MLKIYNSLTRKKEVFKSIKPNEVSLYVCGITPYDTTHLGHAFTYISFDVLVRVLKNAGYKVNYTQNVTDINDRDNDILKRAREKNVSWQDLSDFWTAKFLNDMKTLNWIMPNNYLKASENIEEMIALISKLLSNDYAYSRNGSIYFEISKKKDFGKLSRFTKTKMLEIAKDFEEDIDNPDKKYPLDITLWRATSDDQPAHIPSFDSPFGKGRPGWHIECSAMSTSTLGQQIDIHGGGIDLIYPHHESEIAQSEGATLKIPFVKYWIHTDSVSYLEEKMSKSLGNIVMVSDLLKKYSPNVIRWYLISHHYRSPFEYFEKDLMNVQNDVELVRRALSVNHLLADSNSSDDYVKQFEELINDDLNTPAVLKLIVDLSNKAIKDKRLQYISQLSQIVNILGFKF